jgi:GT2 family glycosyltransferase
MIDLSVAIVSFNTKRILLNCIQSVYTTTKSLCVEIIVVDNASQDGSAEAAREACPDAVVITNPDNRGFAKAVNQALAVSAGRYFLLLNSDTLMEDGALAKMVEYLDAHPEVGALGCRQRTAEGRILRSAFAFPGLREHVLNFGLFKALAPGSSGKYAHPWEDSRTPQDVDWINGACMVVRSEVLRGLGGLDERYFMYFEDVDLCLRIRRLGHRIIYLPEAQIVHFVGSSSEGKAHALNLEWEFSRIIFVETHFSLWRRLFMKGWILTGALVRILRLSVPAMTSPDRAARFRNSLRILRRVLAGPDGRLAQPRPETP